MATIRIKKSEWAKVKAYEKLANLAKVEHITGDIWKIETPEEDFLYGSFAEMMEDIEANLEAMKELVEPEMWEEAWS